MRVISVAEARRHLPALLREAESGEPVAIARRGRRAAILVSAGEFERLEKAAALLEALEISRRLGGMAGVPDAVSAARAGRAELEERS